MAAMISKTANSLDVQALRADFPILSRMVNGKPLVYLDNAATTQKPSSVIQSLVDYYENYNANVHRGVSIRLSMEATDMTEAARKKVARLHQRLGAGDGHLDAERHGGDEHRGAFMGQGTYRSWETRSSQRRWSTTATWCRGRRSRRNAGRLCVSFL